MLQIHAFGKQLKCTHIACYACRHIARGSHVSICHAQAVARMKCGAVKLIDVGFFARDTINIIREWRHFAL